MGRQRPQIVCLAKALLADQSLHNMPVASVNANELYATVNSILFILSPQIWANMMRTMDIDFQGRRQGWGQTNEDLNTGSGTTERAHTDWRRV